MTFAVNSTDLENEKILKEHFNLFYMMLAESKLVPNARFENTKGLYRCLSGIQMPYNNAILGSPTSEYNWDDLITEQLNYFNHAKFRFVWYVDEAESKGFKKKLVAHGFKDMGIFQGVLGSLQTTPQIVKAPNDCDLELVTDEQIMDAFNELVCSTFEIKGIGKEFYKKVLWDSACGSQPTMFHWIARKDGKIVSAVSTRIEDNIVSFWNGATLPDFRRQGFSSALRKLALNDAISKGCSIGTSYLMSAGLALGICRKLGYQTKWRFHAFLAPSDF